MSRVRPVRQQPRAPARRAPRRCGPPRSRARDRAGSSGTRARRTSTPRASESRSARSARRLVAGHRVGPGRRRRTRSAARARADPARSDRRAGASARPATGPATTYASVGWRLPLDGLTRSDHRDVAELLPRRQAERVPQDVADRRWRTAIARMADRRGASGRGVERVLRRAGERSKRIGLGRPVEITERPGEPVEVMLGAVVIGVDGADHRPQPSIAALGFLHAAVDLFDRLRRSARAAARWSSPRAAARARCAPAAAIRAPAPSPDRASVLPCCWRVRSRSNSSMRS